MTPTADQVAHAIIQACREIDGADPIRVARGSLVKKTLPDARARSYAALALGDLFGHDVLAGRMCRASQTYVGMLRWQIKNHSLKGFDPKVLERVKAAVPLAEVEELPNPIQAPKPATPVRLPDPAPVMVMGRRFANPSQRAAYEELEPAVRNTAALPKGT